MNSRFKTAGKRMASFMTAAVMAISIIPSISFSAFAADDFSGGSGTSADPYIISTAADLKLLADKVNAGEESYASAYYEIPTETYTYTKNNVEYTDGVRAVSIDLSAYDPWTPIGTEAIVAFGGVFDGNNHTVSGMYIYNTLLNFVGLFC